MYFSEIHELLEDPAYKRALRMIATEIMRSWGIAYDVAHGYVMSASGWPMTLHEIYDVWRSRSAAEKWGLIATIVRRRTFDLLRKEAPRRDHCPLDHLEDELGELVADCRDLLFTRNPLRSLESGLLIHGVRAALTCFSMQGSIQARQADLLRRHIIEQSPYRQLSKDLACNENALRVRVCKAKYALKEHILRCHPELPELIAS